MSLGEGDVHTSGSSHVAIEMPYICYFLRLVIAMSQSSIVQWLESTEWLAQTPW